MSPSILTPTTRRAFLLSTVLPQLFRLPKTILAAVLPTTSTTSSSNFDGHINAASNLVYILAKEVADEPETKPGSPAFFLKLAVVFCLVLIGGALAGLTLALMSMDTVNLKVMIASGDDKEKKQAGKVLGLLEKGQHWVLVTLLLYNTITNETLPIFLDSILGGGVLAVISSTALILLFGEVIPQAICSRYGMAIGAASTPVMTALMYLSYPLSKPISVLLDRVLGHDEGVTYKRQGLKTFVSLHRHLGAENLLDDEVTIISSVLELSEKIIRDIMVPVEDIYSLSTEQVLDEETVTEILRQGYSRVPVHEAQNKSNFVGMLLVKNLVVYDPEDAKPVSSFSLIPLPETEPGMSCLEALNFFQQGRSHMMLVTDHPGETTGALGIVSLEDVIEELIGEEIIDETDLFLDVANKIKVVRRPQIRTGTAKKLTPLLRDAASRRQNGAGVSMNSYQAPSRRDSSNYRMSRTNSDAGSEAASNTVVGASQTQANYGTIAAVTANSGASTPRFRPSQPHRLGSLTSTALAFDKIKVKGVNGSKKMEAMEAIKQNLEAMGDTVVKINADGGESGSAGQSASNSRSQSPASKNRNGNGNGNGAGSDSNVTITATFADNKATEITASPSGKSKTAKSGGGGGNKASPLSPSKKQRPNDLTLEEVDKAIEESENSPLLGGKQIAGSPGNY